ncbi:MAG: hypothetical protein JRF25_11085, partial [Deltaproteobacteria bacterium]|nr:hypothetical protein [Deltaproteobacteria bacterium]
MNAKKLRSILTVFTAKTIAFALLLTWPCNIAGTVELEINGLFTGINVDGARYADVFDDPTVIRSRMVNLNWDVLHAEGRLQGAELTLNLFEDVVFDVVVDSYKPGGAGKFIITGHIQDVEHSQVVLVVEHSVMSGNIALPGFFYQIRYVDGDIHAIRSIDHSAFPPEAEPILVEPFGEYIQRLPAEAMADDGSIIDVMVVYTEAAKTGAGGITAMNTLINLAVTETNQSYANSGIDQRLRLVYKAAISYDETGFDWDETIDRLQGTSDGYMDNVHTL